MLLISLSLFIARNSFSDNSFLNTVQIKIAQLSIHNYDYMALEDARTKIKPQEEQKFINFLNTLFPEKSPWEN